jgi:hypothetical protein
VIAEETEEEISEGSQIISTSNREIDKNWEAVFPGLPGSAGGPVRRRDKRGIPALHLWGLERRDVYGLLHDREYR